jgi:hypothetical protein
MPTPEQTRKYAVADAAVYLEKDVKGAYAPGVVWVMPDGSKVKPSEVPDIFGVSK